MKKTINLSRIPGLFLWTALLFIPVSCSKETGQESPLADNSQLIKISGEDVSVATKTTLNGLVTSWVITSDKVGIYSPQARTATAGGGSPIVNAEFTAANSAVSSTFTGTMYWGTASTSHTFYAYYPWASGTEASTVVPISLLSAQTQSAAGSNAHIGALDFMVATPVTQTSPDNTNATSGVNLKYNHVFSILEFQIKRTSGSGKITKIKLTAPTTNLCFSFGTINITQSTPGDGVAYTIAGGTGSNEITLTITDGVTPTADYGSTPKIYMMILPGDFSAQTMTIGVEYEISGVFENTTKTGKIFERGKKYVVQMDDTPSTVTDVESNVYNTIRIGSQVWMAENLKTTKYRNGDLIGTTTLDISAETEPKFQWAYAGNESNVATYGRLYTWYSETDSRNVCPSGWHMPSDAEWTTLTGYLGGVNDAGGKLKETGYTHWNSLNTGATNSSGFTALPGGYRDDHGSFSSIDNFGFWWSSTEENTYNDAWFRRMDYNSSSVLESYIGESYGFSVRCVRD